MKRFSQSLFLVGTLALMVLGLSAFVSGKKTQLIELRWQEKLEAAGQTFQIAYSYGGNGSKSDSVAISHEGYPGGVLTIVSHYEGSDGQQTRVEIFSNGQPGTVEGGTAERMLICVAKWRSSTSEAVRSSAAFEFATKFALAVQKFTPTPAPSQVMTTR